LNSWTISASILSVDVDVRMAASSRSSSTLRFTGAAHLRQRLVLATLAGRTVRIDDIRSEEAEVGLKDYEACFLRLLEKVVNGCEIAINETGTALRYRPGIIIGGEKLSHDCGTSRAISYFAEPLLVLAPFAKRALVITLKGVTNGPDDVSVDVLRTVTLPLLRHFGIEGAALHVAKRGAPPAGGGEVRLEVPPVRQLTPISMLDAGKVRRVRGVAYCTKVSAQTANRMVDGSRGVLNHYLPDVWVYTDVHKGKTSGASPGFAVALVAETTAGALLSAELCGGAGTLPEDVGVTAADALLVQIGAGGVVDATHQPLVLSLMCLGPEDVSRVRMGAELTHAAVATLRLLKEVFGVAFQIETDPVDGSLLLACRGVGFKNLSQRVT
jgi:RNA 3'-terminal phosphate cyclase-like protein